MSTRAKKAAAPAAGSSNTLRVTADPKKTREQMLAEVLVDPAATSAATVIAFSGGTFGDTPLTECVSAVRAQAEAVRRGDLAGVESLLMSQALALNSIFASMASRAHSNMGHHLDATDRYMRLALRAQAQCRATLEALAEIKLPRSVAFVAQANVAHGPQQVNNAPPAPAARTEKPATLQNELLEDQHGYTLDTGATGSASRAHQDLAPMGEINRPQD